MESQYWKIRWECEMIGKEIVDKGVVVLDRFDIEGYREVKEYNDSIPECERKKKQLTEIKKFGFMIMNPLVVLSLCMVESETVFQQGILAIALLIFLGIALIFSLVKNNFKVYTIVSLFLVVLNIRCLFVFFANLIFCIMYHRIDAVIRENPGYPNFLKVDIMHEDIKPTKVQTENTLERPKFHFTPQKGWMNDPNGAIYIDGYYHLFYQHFPFDIVWGPMHWGHAVSKDLLHWEHKEIALYPDQFGYIFSGSCILDEDNVTGFGKAGKPALIAIYTSHNGQTGEQQQCIAYSTDYENFTKYKGNPVIKNTIDESAYKVDFRDPKVFKNPINGGFSMVLATGTILEFYHSMDLIHWKKTGEFDPAIHGFSGICECPDCFPILVEETQEEKWILSLSSILDEEKVGLPLSQKGYSNAHVMQYFVGEFNGDAFVDTEESEIPLILDYGTDNYAMVTFSNCKEPVYIGWGEHWDYVSSSPAKEYRGKMTIPRIAKLMSIDQGYRLSFAPYVETNKREYCINVWECVTIQNAYNNPITISVTEEEIIIDRRKAGELSFHEALEKEEYTYLCAKRFKKGKCNVLVIEDKGFFEIFAEDGLITFSVMTYNDANKS